jgi:hypothetical protein
MTDFVSHRWTPNTDLDTATFLEMSDNDLHLKQNLKYYGYGFDIVELQNARTYTLNVNKSSYGTIEPESHGKTEVELNILIPKGIQFLQLGCQIPRIHFDDMDATDAYCGVIFGAASDDTYNTNYAYFATTPITTDATLYASLSGKAIYPLGYVGQATTLTISVFVFAGAEGSVTIDATAEQRYAQFWAMCV